MREGPYNSNTSPAEALEQITAYRANCEELRTTESSIKRGLGLFKIDQTENKELSELEADLSLLEAIWNVAGEWEGLWNEWKVSRLITEGNKLKKIAQFQQIFLSFSRKKFSQFFGA